MLIQITVCNRGPEAATLHVLPTLWFRNTWSLGRQRAEAVDAASSPASEGSVDLRRRTHDLGDRYLYCDGDAALLFTENETNNERLFGTAERQSVRERRVSTTTWSTGKQDAVNPEQTGPKRRRITRSTVPARESSDDSPAAQRCARRQQIGDPFEEFDETFARRASAKPTILSHRSRPNALTEDEARVMRQALAGMLWTKQYLRLRCGQVARRSTASIRWTIRSSTHSRNREWFHMINADVISMPDKWEYPWYAAWDLAFHVHCALDWWTSTSPRSSST